MSALPSHIVKAPGRRGLSRGKKRKAGDMALDDLSSFSELREAAILQLDEARSEAHRKKCIDSATVVVKWLVDHNATANLKRVDHATSSSSSTATRVSGSYNGWAFDFKNLGNLTMDVITFLKSRKRQLASGDIVPDAASNLNPYRTGVRFLFTEEQKFGSTVRPADINTWEKIMADFFKSLDKGETKLKRDGKLTTKTGETNFLSKKSKSQNIYFFSHFSSRHHFEI